MKVGRTVAGRALSGEIVQLCQLRVNVVILAVRSVEVSLQIEDFNLSLELVRGEAGGGRGWGGGGSLHNCG